MQPWTFSFVVIISMKALYCIARLEPDGTRWRTGGEVKGKIRREWVASSLALYVGTRSIQSLSADPHSSTVNSRLKWHPRRFKWTRPFRWKTKSGFCACAITFRTCYNCKRHGVVAARFISERPAAFDLFQKHLPYWSTFIVSVTVDFLKRV